MSKTYKNIMDDGYTTYHDNGCKSTTYKNLTDNGYTTYHEDGSTSVTYKNVLDNGSTTFHYNSNGSPNHPQCNNFGASIGIVWFLYVLFCGFFSYCIYNTIGSEMWKYLLLMFVPSVVLLFLRNVVNGSVLSACAHSISCLGARLLMDTLKSTHTAPGDASLWRYTGIFGLLIISVFSIWIVVEICDLDNAPITVFYFCSYALVLLVLPIIKSILPQIKGVSFHGPLDYYWLGVMLIVAVIDTVFYGHRHDLIYRRRSNRS
jgi:hypothetical protein